MDERRIITDDYVEQPDDKLTLVSDASVHINNNTAAGAWQLYRSKDQKRRISQLLEPQDHSHSYRHELETFHLALKDADTQLKHPHQITQYMDCEAALKKLSMPIYKPGHTMVTDADIIMAHNQLKANLQHTVTEKWVMGHASDKKREQPHTITEIERANSECDSDAEHCIQDGTTPRPFRPFPGYRAMLKLNGRWITTHFRECIQFANVAPPMIEYVKRRLDIDDATFHSINWTSIGRVRATHKFGRIVRTSKMMYGWMPVGHNWYKCKLESDRCPCCGAKDETFEHLLACDHEDLTVVKKNAYLRIQKKCDEAKIPLNLTRTFLTVIRSILGTTTTPILNLSDTFAPILLAQKQIGYYNMIVGFMALEWTTTLTNLGVEHPQTKSELLLTLLWDEICEPIWAARNNIKFHKKNFSSLDEMSTLSDKLHWYQRHQDEVLDYRHRFLVDYSSEDVGHWTRATRRAKLEMLNNARKFYEVECKQNAQQQTTIYNWMARYKKLRSGRIIGEGLTNAWDVGRRPHFPLPPTTLQRQTSECSEEHEFDWEPSTSDYSEEYEFNWEPQRET